MAGIFGNSVELACMAKFEAPYLGGAAHIIVKPDFYKTHILSQLLWVWD